MTNEERLDRGQKAFDAGRFAAAAIDARSVLQAEEDNARARLLLGRTFYETGDYAAAESDFRKALELGVSYPDVAIHLGTSLLQQQKFDDIIELIDPARIADSDDLNVIISLRGDAYLGLSRPLEARNAYEIVLGQNPADIGAMLGIALSYVEQGNPTQARQTLDFVLQENPDSPLAWTTSGHIHAATGNWEGAEKDFARAAQIAQDSNNHTLEIPALVGQATAQVELDRQENARSILRRLNTIAPEDQRALIVAARIAASERNWLDAQNALLTILRRNPKYRPAQVMLGQIYQQSGDLEQAEMYLSAALAGEPGNVIARRLLVETRLQRHKATEAQQALAPLLETSQPDAADLKLAANASLQLGQVYEAVDLLQRAVANQPEDISLRLQLAYALLQAGREKEALAELGSIDANPEAEQKLIQDSLIVLALLARNRADSARTHAEDVVLRLPDSSAARILLGLVEINDGNYEVARRLFEKADSLDPTNTAALWFLGQVDELLDDYAGAQHRYETILEREPANTRAALSIASILVETGQIDEARELLEDAQRLDSQSVGVIKGLGRIHLMQKRYSHAETTLSEGLSIDDQDDELHMLTGVARLQQGNERGAEESFSIALALAPNDVGYRLNLGLIHARRGDYLTAASTLERSDVDILQSLSAGMLLASLKAEAGLVGEAMQIASILKTMYPDAAGPYALEGEILARRRDFAAAALAYGKALELEMSEQYATRAFEFRTRAKMPDPIAPLLAFSDARPLNSSMRVYLAQAYQMNGDLEASISEYEKALDIAPDNYVAANNLAWNYLLSEDSRAEGVARYAYSLNPRSSTVMDTLGWVLVKSGALDEGIERLRDAVSLDPDSPESQYHLAYALAQAGNTPEAKKILAKLTRGDQAFSSRIEAEELLTEL